MAGSMTVVAVRSTGQVLGAVTRVAAADVPLTVEAVAGDAFPARLAGAVTDVPAAQLAVAALPVDAAVLADPASATVTFPPADRPDEEPTLVFVMTTDRGELSAVAADTFVVSLRTAGGGAAGAVSADTPFWVLLRRAGSPADVVTGQVPDGAAESDPVRHTLAPGSTYAALVLVQGFAPHVMQVSTP